MGRGALGSAFAALRPIRSSRVFAPQSPIVRAEIRPNRERLIDFWHHDGGTAGRRGGPGVAESLASKELAKIRERGVGNDAGEQNFPHLTHSPDEVPVKASSGMKSRWTAFAFPAWRRRSTR